MVKWRLISKSSAREKNGREMFWFCFWWCDKINLGTSWDIDIDWGLLWRYLTGLRAMASVWYISSLFWHYLHVQLYRTFLQKCSIIKLFSEIFIDIFSRELLLLFQIFFLKFPWVEYSTTFKVIWSRFQSSFTESLLLKKGTLRRASEGFHKGFRAF